MNKQLENNCMADLEDYYVEELKQLVKRLPNANKSELKDEIEEQVKALVIFLY